MLSKILVQLLLSTSLTLAKPCKPDIIPSIPDIQNTNSTFNATSTATTARHQPSSQIFISKPQTQSRTGASHTTSPISIIGPALPPTRSAFDIKSSATSDSPLGTSNVISDAPSSSSTSTTRGYPKLSSPTNSLSTSTTSKVGSVATGSSISRSSTRRSTARNSPVTSLTTTSPTTNKSPKVSPTSGSSISPINSFPTGSPATDSLITDSLITDSSTTGSSPPINSFSSGTSTLESSTSSTRGSLTSTTTTSSSVTTGSTTTSSLTTTSSSESDSSTSTTSSSAVANPTFYLQASDVTLRREPNDTIEDPNLYRSNGLYAQLYSPYYSEYLTFAATDPGPPAATFYINEDGHLVHAENGWILDTQPDYLSHQVYFDEDPYEDDYAPPNCKIDPNSLVLSCSITRQKEFSICFGSSESRLGSNGKLYMTGNAFNQGRQCRAVTLNVRPI